MEREEIEKEVEQRARGDGVSEALRSEEKQGGKGREGEMDRGLNVKMRLRERSGNER